MQPINATLETVIQAADGALTIKIAAGTAPQGSTVKAAPLAENEQPRLGSGLLELQGQVFEITLADPMGTPIRTFTKPLVLTFTYDPKTLPPGVSLQDLQVFYYDEELGRWIVVPTEHNRAAGTITATTNHLTIFAVMAAPGLKVPTDLAGHWSQADVLKLVSLGVVHGYENGTFRAQDHVTRAEFTKMLVGVLPLPVVQRPVPVFSDQADIPAWARSFVQAAVGAGYVQGFDDNTFRADTPITREQAAVMMVRISDAGPVEALSFADAAAIAPWARSGVAGAVHAGIIVGYEDGSFQPQKAITRAEAAVMVARLISMF